jgi:hypothetical protein
MGLSTNDLGPDVVRGWLVCSHWFKYRELSIIRGNVGGKVTEKPRLKQKQSKSGTEWI